MLVRDQRRQLVRKRHLKVKRRLLVFLAALGLGLIGLYLVSGDALWHAETYRGIRLKPVLIGISVAALAGLWLAPAWRIQALCRAQGLHLGLKGALLTFLGAHFAGAVTPGKAGGGPALALMLKRSGMRLGAGMSVMIQVVVLDLLFYAITIPLCVVYLTQWSGWSLPAGLGAAAWLLAGAVVGLAALLLFAPQLIVRLIVTLARLGLLKRYARALHRVAWDYRGAARTFMNIPARQWPLLLAFTALAWGSNYLLLWVVLSLYNAGVPLWDVLALTNLVNVAGNLIPTPGAAGFTEVMIGLGAQQGLMHVVAPLLLWRIVTFYSIFLLGPVALAESFRTAPRGLRSATVRKDVVLPARR